MESKSERTMQFEPGCLGSEKKLSERTIWDFLGLERKSAAFSSLAHAVNLQGMEWMGYCRPPQTSTTYSDAAGCFGESIRTSLPAEKRERTSIPDSSASSDSSTSSGAEQELALLLHFLRAEGKKAEQDCRTLFEYLKQEVRALNSDATCVVVGSTAARTTCPSSDLDVTIFLPEHREGKEFLRHLDQALAAKPDFETALILTARVPILKLAYDKENRKKLPRATACDVSVGQDSGVWHSLMMTHCDQIYNTANGGMLLVKQWVKVRQFPDPKAGGIPMIAWMIIAISCCKELSAEKERPSADSSLTGNSWLSFLTRFFEMITNRQSDLFRKDVTLFETLDEGSNGESEYIEWLGAEDCDSTSSLVGTASSRQSKPAWDWAFDSEWTVPKPRVKDPVNQGDLISALPISLWLLIHFEATRAKSFLQQAHSAPLGQVSSIIQLVFHELPACMSSVPAVGTKLQETKEGEAVTCILILCNQELWVGFIFHVCKSPDWKGEILRRHDANSVLHTYHCTKTFADKESPSGTAWKMDTSSEYCIHPIHVVRPLRAVKRDNGLVELDMESSEFVHAVTQHYHGTSAAGNGASSFGPTGTIQRRCRHCAPLVSGRKRKAGLFVQGDNL